MIDAVYRPASAGHRCRRYSRLAQRTQPNVWFMAVSLSGVSEYGSYSTPMYLFMAVGLSGWRLWIRSLKVNVEVIWRSKNKPKACCVSVPYDSGLGSSSQRNIYLGLVRRLSESEYTISTLNRPSGFVCFDPVILFAHCFRSKTMQRGI